MARAPVLVCLVFLLALGRPAGAESPENTPETEAGPSPSPATMAIRHAYAGRERFEAGDYRGALIEFERSRALAISPVVDLYMARSYRALGHWLLARQNYRACLSVAQDPDNTTWIEAQKRSSAELAELDSAFPRLSVAVPGLTGGESVELRVDGVTYPWGGSGGLELDPGAHVVVAVFGEESFATQVVVSPGEQTTLTLPFQSGLAGPAPLQSDLAPPAPAPAHAVARRSDPLMPWIVGSFAVAGVGIVFGSVAGIVTLNKAGTVHEFCAADGNHCPGSVPEDPEVARTREEALGWATAATVSFITGGTAAALGGTLLFLRRPADSTAGLGLKVAGPSLFLEGRF